MSNARAANPEVLGERARIQTERNIKDRLLDGLDTSVRRMSVGIKSRLRMLVPRQLKKHRILSGPLRGRWIVTSWQQYHTGMLGTTERGLMSWFHNNVKAGETWLDIGANYGYTALAMQRLAGPDGRVFAFEPKLSTCGCLSQTMLLNRLPEVITVPMGLGSPESVELKRLVTIGGMVACGSKTVDEFRSRVREIAKSESLETIAVARLDWLWPQICGYRNRVDGVKIDVQGMELEVLQGMTEILKAHRPKLVVEIHAGIDGGVLLGLLESCGYQRRGTPIYTVPGEEQGPQYYDNLSYAFSAK